MLAVLCGMKLKYTRVKQNKNIFLAVMHIFFVTEICNLIFEIDTRRCSRFHGTITSA